MKHVSSGPKSVPTSVAPEAAVVEADAGAGAGYFTMRSSFLLLRESLIQISASYKIWFV